MKGDKNMTTINEFIVLISDLTNIPTENITPKSSFVNDLGIDSLGLVNLFLQLADKTGVAFNQFVNQESVQTVEDVFRIVKGG